MGNAEVNGVVMLTLQSTITYTPDANYNGPASFSYTVTDDGTTNGVADPKTSTATVNVTVSEVNDAPTAANDSKTDRKSTRLNSSHLGISYTVFCLPTNES